MYMQPQFYTPINPIFQGKINSKEEVVLYFPLLCIALIIAIMTIIFTFKVIIKGINLNSWNNIFTSVITGCAMIMYSLMALIFTISGTQEMINFFKRI